jgi:hypothetical protein
VGQGATSSVHVGIAAIAKKATPASPHIVGNELVCNIFARGLLLPCPPGALLQKNGDAYFCSLNFAALYVYEFIDFTRKKLRPVQERAGWMAYMFNDIKQAEEHAQAYSLYRPNPEDAGDVVEYAKKMLGSESVLVNWADDNQRGKFLRDRQHVAESGFQS